MWLTYISSGIFPHWVNHSHTLCARSLSKVLSVYVLISERRNAATMQDYCVTLTLLLISQHLSCGGGCACICICACVCVTWNTEGTTKQNPITSTFGITGKTPLSNPCVNKRCWCGSVTQKMCLLAANLDVPRYGVSEMCLSLPTHHFWEWKGVNHTPNNAVFNV